MTDPQRLPEVEDGSISRLTDPQDRDLSGHVGRVSHAGAYQGVRSALASHRQRILDRAGWSRRRRSQNVQRN